MTAKDENLSQIIDILREKEDKSPPNQMFFDNLSKIALAICTAGVIWLISSTAELQKNMVASNVKQEEFEQDITELKNEVRDFSHKPRFSYDEFNRGVAPINQKIEGNTKELNSRSPVFDDLQQRVSKVENKYETLLNYQVELKTKLNTLLDHELRDNKRGGE